MIARKQSEYTVAGYDANADKGSCWFDDSSAGIACQFFPTFCTHIKGKIARQPLELNPWERSLVRNLFGWKREDGSRRFREAFVGIPRKNSKTTLAAGLSLLLLLMDREDGAEIYFAASDKDQASLCFDIAAKMVKASPFMSSKCIVKDSVKRIVFGNSFMRAIPADAAGSHGFNAHGIIIDELHTQPNRDLYDVLKTSTASRRQPLVVSITTAGTDRESICYELWEHARKVRDGEVKDRSFLPCIYELEKGDNWKHKKTWKKCNPNLGRSVSIEYLEEAFERAKKTPSFENTFRNLHLNQWTDSASRWITTESWVACQGELPDLTGCECVAGLDLAATDDITALVYVFHRDEKFYVVPHFYCPEDTIRERPKKYHTQYEEWVRRGLLTVTPGSSTRYDYVRKQVLDDSQRYRIRQIAFDQWQALDTFQQLEARGFDCVKISQTTQGLHPGTKAVEEAVHDRQLVHDGNPILRWMLGCTVVETDHSGNRRPHRKKSSGEHFQKGKIDGIVALIMAMGRAGITTPGNVYNERGAISL